MKPLYPSSHSEVDIHWQEPIPYNELLENGSNHDNEAWLYQISAKYSTFNEKSLYIGKTYDQYVRKRLKQNDHKKRYELFTRKYPNHKLLVSHGIIKLSAGKLTRKRLSDIENILIYSNNPSHTHNIKNFYQHGVNRAYTIRNHGYYFGLPSTISLGVFIKE